jgi:polysaccharide export outer membrane protein
MQLEKDAPVVILLVTIVFMLSSCVSHQELITLNGSDPADLERGLNQPLGESKIVTPKSFIIHPSDLLIINVSAFEGNTSEFLQAEFGSRNLNSSGRDFGPNALYYNSYQVGADGYISLPLIDRIKAEGLNTSELKSKLDSAYTPYLKFASTSVKLANLRVTVLGEVKSPGVHYFFNDQTTILEAISLAGDFTDFGNRKKIKLIRRTESGAETVMLDLSKPDFIGTEYFFVRPNDLIYIEPIKAKAFDVGAQSVGIVLSVISTAALLANILLDIKKN